MARAFGGSNAGSWSETSAGETIGVATVPDLFWSVAPNAAVGAQVTPAIDIRNSATATLSDRRVNIALTAADRPRGEARRAECMTPHRFFSSALVSSIGGDASTATTLNIVGAPGVFPRQPTASLRRCL
jgi:hypothetical protein